MAKGFNEYEPGGKFPGVIGKTIDDSTEAWPVPARAPEGAPNVLFYVLDDIGFGQLSPYGGLVEPPHLQRVVDAGVLYTNDQVQKALSRAAKTETEQLDDESKKAVKDANAGSRSPGGAPAETGGPWVGR